MVNHLLPFEAAEQLNVTVQRLAEWRSAGIGPAYLKLGHRTVRYCQADLDRWVDEHRVEPGGTK